MKQTWIGLSLFACGCIAETAPGSHEVAVVDGDWVLAPSISDAPVLADEVPAGVPAMPVSLRIVEGEIVVSPVDTMDATDDDDDDTTPWTHHTECASSATGSATDTLGGAGSSIGPSVSEDLAFLRDASFPDWDPTTAG